MFQGRSVNIVVQAEPDKPRALLFTSRGTCVCNSAAEVGSWCIRIARDENEPVVDVGTPGGRFLPKLAKIADSLQAPDGPLASRGVETAKPVHEAVQLVVMVEPAPAEGEADEQRAMVWPTMSRPRIAVGEDELGAVVLELARDSREPKVAAGPAPDGVTELAHRGLDLLADYLRS